MHNRRDFLGFAATSCAALAISRVWSRPSFDHPGSDPWQELPKILARIKPPVFPARDFDLTKFGAVGDNRTDCTEAFRKAIEACSKARGGRIVVPKGDFHTGAIHLKSNVNLHVASGGAIRFSRDPRKYPLVFTRFEGMELMNYSPFIYAWEQENIAISGPGIIDGQADCNAWWPWKGRANCGWKAGDPNQIAARTALSDMAEKGVPVGERVFGEGHYLRPQFIQTYRCKNVLVEGVTLLNSPMWQVHPVLCTNVTVRDLTIGSPNGPNTDGCDPESCTDVLIKNCEFSTGDDCIAVKAGRNADGRRQHTPSKNIVIQNCRMKNGHGGITLGSEISGGVQNVFAETCVLDSPRLDYAVRFKSNAARGGVLENVHVRNLAIGEVARAVVTVDFLYEEGEKGDYTPVLRNVSLNNLKCRRARHALYLRGLKKGEVSGIVVEDCDFQNVAEPNVVENIRSLVLRNVRINGRIVDQS